MSGPSELAVRLGRLVDADTIGRLRHDFNREFDELTPDPVRLAERVRQLLAGGGYDGAARTRTRRVCCAAFPPRDLE